MIDSNFMIRYTNALYSTPPEYAPRYDEFRDMFSSGQIKSKEWAVQELLNINKHIHIHSAAIMGCWYGTLGLMLKNAFPKLFLELVDIDPRCEKFNEKIFYDIKHVNLHTMDMYDWQGTEDLIINTSCEHILNLEDWVLFIPEDTMVLLQSNNYLAGNGHINCVNSKEEFITQSGLKNILYSGELVMPMYTRYMVIGII
jgi:hypothetical protein